MKNKQDNQSKASNNDAPSSSSPYIMGQQIVPGSIKQQNLVSHPVHTGAIYYGKEGNFIALDAGNEGQVLQIVSSVPAWTSFTPGVYTTTQRNAITTPSTGMIIFNNTTSKLNFYNGSAWAAVTSV
jgi:hypothetical protein